ncbi:Protein CBG09337 [Caenorhabditis briggsae]|uniref:Protein CBG09337 n=1 Tax=Caenorhabditis briggsae TaxID=6238 RepID=A8X9C0_CAEBR|nr:Protein CBG09337 [Caenorhabditis briggsae]CAP29232.2 Protein CBG09337 [Caenorhabditis briggsae]
MVDSGVDNDTPSPPAYSNEALFDDDIYGELILLGFNGQAENRSTSKRYLTKKVLKRRDVANGIKKLTSHTTTSSDNKQLIKDKTRHTVSFHSDHNKSVVVEYEPDSTKDMFQIGRASDDQIDFTVIDTWMFHPENSETAVPSRPQIELLEKGDRTSTISRFACRILIDRENSNKAFLYAAGFDCHQNISINQKSLKWTKPSGEVDGLTTNGVLILHPNKDDLLDDTVEKPMYKWREVSINGDVYEPRVTRSSSAKGVYVPEWTNMLQDGTLIDLCGATILWRTADGLERSPKMRELEMALDLIPKKRNGRQVNRRQPYVYLQCGHVQGKHEWGVHVNSGQRGGKCPICLVESDRIVQLSMGMEPSFHLDPGVLDHAFNPCGHMASKQTVLYWSRIPLPQGTCRYDPVCPFCYQLLATERPFVRLIFQDNCFDDDTIRFSNEA